MAKRRSKKKSNLGLGHDADAAQRRVNELEKAEYVTVKLGETLSKIAEHYGISVTIILEHCTHQKSLYVMQDKGKVKRNSY